ncbi:hypothetical protein Gogos_017380 [Gossypium gossypioides]|uniref:Uncharacterized protein n=1 Tax=Gossypium gossypioides TaxID=34282 RepID=A0A7J9BAH2_GOSGO|nr:hypothetical protein [Gossypium gossypioides]
MAKVSFVAFSLTLVLSSQFIVGQNEKAIDEAASPEAVGVFGALVMTGIISKLQDDGMQGEHLKKIIADPNFVSRVDKLIEKFKSSVGDNSGSVDGTTFALADEVAASPESEEEIATEVSNGLLKMEKEGLVDLGDVTSDPNFKEEVAKAIRYFRSNANDNANTENEKN